jgi:hypothetical protein
VTTDLHASSFWATGWICLKSAQKTAGRSVETGGPRRDDCASFRSGLRLSIPVGEHPVARQAAARTRLNGSATLPADAVVSEIHDFA